MSSKESESEVVLVNSFYKWSHTWQRKLFIIFSPGEEISQLLLQLFSCDLPLCTDCGCCVHAGDRRSHVQTSDRCWTVERLLQHMRDVGNRSILPSDPPGTRQRHQDKTIGASATTHHAIWKLARHANTGVSCEKTHASCLLEMNADHDLHTALILSLSRKDN